MKKKILLIVLVCIATVLIATGATVYYYIFSRSFNIPDTAYVYIDRDDTADSVFHKMEKKLAPTAITGFKWLTKYYDYDKQVHTGRYAILTTDNMAKVFRRFAKGKQTPVDLSFNNIRTRGQLARKLGNQLMLDSAEIAQRMYDSTYCAGLGYKEETVISLFIPNTYEVYWDVTVDDFFERMQKEHDKFWTKERLAKTKEIGLTPEEVTTLASIVEEETNNNDEKPMVAGLYMNRLLKDMPLQADPTVKFGLQDFSLKRIYKNHLAFDSPYNTYKHTGLPPGPIRIPSIKGIDSVLNYIRHDYIYMCAKEDFSGTHNFASTFAAHQANAKKYWNALNNRKIF